MNAAIFTRSKGRGPKPGTASPKQAMANAKKAWGKDLPEYVETLARACDRTSQAMVSRRLNYTTSVISAVINRKYNGNLETVEKAVRGALMAEKLICPVLGEIKTNVCLEQQKRARTFYASSGYRVELFRHCRGGCMHSRLSQTMEGAADAQPKA